MDSLVLTHKKESNSFVLVVDNLIHIFIIAVLFYILWYPVLYFKSLMSLHAIVGTVGFLLLMSESITLLSSNPWFTKFISTKREKKIWTHGILFTTATIFAVLSVCFEYYRKYGHKLEHFYTVHGITALLATILSLFAFITGLLVTNCHQFQEKIRPVVIKLVHNIFGQLAYGLGMFSLSCSCYSNWMVSRTTALERNALVVIMCFVTFWILIHAVKSLFYQIKSLKD